MTASLSQRFDAWGRRHLVFLTLATLTLAALATIALLRIEQSEGVVIIYQGF